MKEDDARVDYKEHQILLYVEKSDGSFGPIQTGGYMSKNYIDDFFLKRKNLQIECFEKIRNGEISTVAYYMLLNNMTAADVAVRAGVSVSKVKKHERPAGFAKASVDLVRRYADVFGISVANMFQLVVPKEENFSIASTKTANPFVSVLEIGRRNP